MDARSELLFEATTPLGFRVRVDRTRWQLIVNEKHPAMKGREADVTVSLENPDEVRQEQERRRGLSLLQSGGARSVGCAPWQGDRGGRLSDHCLSN